MRREPPCSGHLIARFSVEVVAREIKNEVEITSVDASWSAYSSSWQGERR